MFFLFVQWRIHLVPHTDTSVLHIYSVMPNQTVWALTKVDGQECTGVLPKPKAAGAGMGAAWTGVEV